MSDSEDDIAEFIILAALNEICDDNEDDGQRQNKRRRRIQAKEWLQKRNNSSSWELLYTKVEESDEVKFQNVFHINPDSFDVLLKRGEPQIRKQDTKMRTATFLPNFV